MKVIKSDTSGIYAFQKIFKEIYTNELSLVVWQFNPETKERAIADSKINSYHLESGILNFNRPSNYDLTIGLPLYFYSEEGQLIFKSFVKEMKDRVLIVESPSEIKILEESDQEQLSLKVGIAISTIWKSKSIFSENLSNDHLKVKSLSERTTRDQDFLKNEFEFMSVDEEDRLFAEKRESPRGRPVVDKWIRVRSQLDGEDYYVKIFDLSRGGVGFVTLDTKPFEKGTNIQILSFDDFILDDPLHAQVVAIRPLDESGVEVKIGCKFDEGQA